ncbi:DUF7344 domain-containing protein [Candidatus Halobonum tyrrellensis]|uniref:DUF7344 domain-containing protein n=1 Tax=Candidatus Halobonum tyrrellensis G22 TaxID=1324957 RepID=V4HGH8_9EURY|nr:hypothetical protein [Candidatus Halobonum tyrrellensis]ESP86909.1 hypothetical protein K933_16647 [Candidatus Halobonum tyrrellensis G22]
MSDAETAGLSEDLAFTLLSNPRRRFVISYLSHHGSPVGIHELAEQIAAWESGTDVDELTREDRKKTYISLYQTHVPKLEEAGVVTYDDEERLVALTGDADEVTRYMTERHDDRPWLRYYLALGVAGGVVAGAAAVDVPGFDALPDAYVALGLAAGFLLLAGYHYLETRDGADVPEYW